VAVSPPTLGNGPELGHAHATVGSYHQVIRALAEIKIGHSSLLGQSSPGISSSSSKTTVSSLSPVFHDI